MENVLYIGLSRQLAAQRQMTLVANNIANINTPGYRAQAPLFEEYLEDPRGEKFEYSQVLTRGQYDITAPGPLRETGNPLDIALVGPGFIGVATPAGVKYTRSGNFTLNAQGQLTTANGIPVAATGGAAITIPPEAKNVKILDDGTVATDQGPIGQILIAEFENPQTLAPEGSGLYGTEAAPQPSPTTRVVQGSLEGSNVQGVLEMTRMIEVSREYQSLQQMLQQQHERQRSTVQRMLQIQS